MIEVTLKIDNEDKKFVAPFISARMLKNTIKQFGDTETKTDESTIDEMVAYIVDIFGKQFTIDQLYDGIASGELISKFTECVQNVTGNLQVKSAALASNSTEKNV